MSAWSTLSGKMKGTGMPEKSSKRMYFMMVRPHGILGVSGAFSR
jgi:hypothetical protein